MTIDNNVPFQGSDETVALRKNLAILLEFLDLVRSNCNPLISSTLTRHSRVTKIILNRGKEK